MPKLIVWILIDLYWPARGLIMVSPQSVIDLQQTLQHDVP